MSLSAPGQLQTLTVPAGLPGGNQNEGILFDVQNLSVSPVTIEGLQVIFAQAGLLGVTLEVWAKAGTVVGSQSTPGAWTLASSVVFAGPSQGPGLLDTPGLCFVGLPLLQIGAGQVIGLYVTTTGGGPQLVYSTVSGSVGDLVASDGTLAVRAGFGGSYPFGSQFAPRAFNGTITYRMGGGSANPWVQVNTPEATMIVDGQQGTECRVAGVQRCVGENFPLVLSSTLGGTLWDLILQAGEPMIPGAVSPGGQVVNLDISQGPGFWLSLAGAAPPPGSFPLTTLSWPVGSPPITIPLLPPGPALVHAQAYWINVASVDFVSVSAPSRVQVRPTSGATLPLLLGDDTSIAVDLTTLCAAPISYYGVSYSSFFVNANGSVSFVQPSADFSSSPGEFTTQMPRIAGLWTDLSPNIAGTVSALTTSNGITVNFVGVPQFNTTNANSVSISLSSSGATTISNYAASPTYQFAPTLMGFSSGALGTNPGSISGGIVSRLGAGVQTGNIGSDAIYEFNLFLPPAGGWSTFTLLGNGSAWQVQ